MLFLLLVKFDKLQSNHQVHKPSKTNHHHIRFCQYFSKGFCTYVGNADGAEKRTNKIERGPHSSLATVVEHGDLHQLLQGEGRTERRQDQCYDVLRAE